MPIVTKVFDANVVIFLLTLFKKSRFTERRWWSFIIFTEYKYTIIIKRTIKISAAAAIILDISKNLYVRTSKNKRSSLKKWVYPYCYASNNYFLLCNNFRIPFQITYACVSIKSNGCYRSKRYMQKGNWKKLKDNFKYAVWLVKI